MNAPRPTTGEMLDRLRSKYPEPRIPILRPPGSNGFIELSREEWDKAITDLEHLFLRINLGDRDREDRSADDARLRLRLLHWEGLVVVR